MRRRAFLAPLAALAFFAAIVSVARADVHAPVGFGRGQTFLRSARKVFNTEGGGDDDARGRRLVENDPRYGAAVRRVLLADARDGPSEGGGEGAGDESGVVTPPRHGTDTPQRRVNVGVARLARRAVDAEDELAAEAKGTKPRLTSPRPGPRGRLGASAKRASTTRDAGDDRPKIPTTDGPERENLDPRWRLLLDDDDDDDDDAPRAPAAPTAVLVPLTRASPPPLARDDGDVCAICLEALGDAIDCTVMPCCRVEIHAHCLASWCEAAAVHTAAAGRLTSAASCPNCRRDVPVFSAPLPVGKQPGR